MKHLRVYTDGGARGNPGPAAIGVLITDEKGKVEKKLSRTIGKSTNNKAEYKAVIEALEHLLKNKDAYLENYRRADFYIDSQLVVSQLNGQFKVKDSNLRELLLKVRMLESMLKMPVYYHKISREKNREADRLVNSALGALKI